MICPKCRFSQPDDIYCALCGVNIKRYAQQKRRQRRNISVWGAFFVLTTLTAITFFTSFSKDDPLEKTSNSEKAGSAALLGHDATQGRNARPEPSTNTPRQQVRPERRNLDIKNTGIGTPPPTDSDATLVEDESEQGQLTARQWFEKGKRLDDDSDAEIECYLMAIEIDPEFAPAAFRLAAIYFRQAKYEMADREFAHFLRNASDEDKKNYDIYEHYSLADVERLYEAIALQDMDETDTKDTEPPLTLEQRQGEATVPESDGSGQESDEDVMTVVGFSQANGQIVVPVVLNNMIHAKVLVDTGAGITVLSSALSDQLGLHAEPGPGITLKTMATDVQAQLARLDSIRVGAINRHDLLVAVADLHLGGQDRFQGILGMDFMNHYTINIDNEKKRISLKPRKSYRPS